LHVPLSQVKPGVHWALLVQPGKPPPVCPLSPLPLPPPSPLGMAWPLSIKEALQLQNKKPTIIPPVRL